MNESRLKKMCTLRCEPCVLFIIYSAPSNSANVNHSYDLGVSDERLFRSMRKRQEMGLGYFSIPFFSPYWLRNILFILLAYTPENNMYYFMYFRNSKLLFSE